MRDLFFPVTKQDQQSTTTPLVMMQRLVSVQRGKAKHKARLDDWKIFDCAQWEVCTFIIACVEDTWIRELQDPITGCAYVAPRVIMMHLWKLCNGLHSIDILALRTSMLTLHQDAEGIAEYTNTLEDAKKRPKRANAANTFTAHDLVLVSTNA